MNILTQVQPTPGMVEKAERVRTPHNMLGPITRGLNASFPMAGNLMSPLTNRILHGLDMQDEAAYSMGGKVTDLASKFLPPRFAAFLGAGTYAAANMFDGTPGANPAMVMYHGSPHKFTKFDMSKIGTGEGAQAYGRGLYFAENESTGRFYQQELAKENAIFEGPDGVGHKGDSFRRRLHQIALENGANRADAGLMADETYLALLNGDDFNAHRSYLANDSAESPEFIRAYNAVMDDAQNFRIVTPQGHLYTVDIPDEAIDRMLDWDAPLSEQPEAVRDAINRVAREPESYGLDRISDDMRGIEIKRLLQDPRAVERLKKLGVPGIKYFDGMSRTKGEGTRNVVVFDDSLIKVLSRNGEPVE